MLVGIIETTVKLGITVNGSSSLLTINHLPAGRQGSQIKPSLYNYHNTTFF